MTVADILTIAFGIVAIIVGVPILLYVICVIGVFMFGVVLDILKWLEDNFGYDNHECGEQEHE